MPHRVAPRRPCGPRPSRTCYDPSVSVPLSQPGEPIRIGISSCLLGQKVRFDGGHKRDSFLTDTLGRYVEWVPVCPEVEVGMGTPRETVHLVRDVPRSSRTGEGVPVPNGRTRERRRLDRPHGGLRTGAGREACGARSLRIRPEEGLAKLRHGAGQGARAGRDARALRYGALCRSPACADADAAHRRRGEAVRAAPARELRGARVRVSPAPHAVCRAVERGSAGAVPRRAQANPARARTGRVCVPRRVWSRGRRRSPAWSCRPNTNAPSWRPCPASPHRRVM